MKALKVVAALIIFNMMLIGAGQAANYHKSNSDYYGAGIDVDIVSDSRGVLRQYPADMQQDNIRRSYVEARGQDRYSLRLRNNTSERVGVVIAVDGRNIISGRRSYLSYKERMYILDPWEHAEYEGWRTAKNRVSRFYFTDEEDSYAAAWGDYSAMGVISVAAFTERKRKKRQQIANGSRNGLASGHSFPMETEAGTGMGEETRSVSRRVSFKPRKRPLMEKVIRYEGRSSLCRKHIISCRKHREGWDRNRFWPGEAWDYGNDYAPRRW